MKVISRMSDLRLTQLQPAPLGVSPTPPGTQVLAGQLWGQRAGVQVFSTEPPEPGGSWPGAGIQFVSVE